MNCAAGEGMEASVALRAALRKIPPCSREFLAACPPDFRVMAVVLNALEPLACLFPFTLALAGRGGLFWTPPRGDVLPLPPWFGMLPAAAVSARETVHESQAT